MPTVALHTLGCKLNYAETSTLGRQFREQGYTLVEFGAPADVCVINTCTVTARADRECRQTIRRALRASPEAYVIVTGCYAQLSPEAVASIEGVDLVLGSREKAKLFEYYCGAAKESVPRVVVSDLRQGNEFGPAYSGDVDGRTRAFLKVQDGCDYTCSFCTIPQARGRSRSQPIEETVAQTRRLVARGYQEVVLTGVNVGEYGRSSGQGLLPLVKSLAAVEGLRRLRISSIEPNLLSDDIIAFAADSPVLCNHFHIPLQSGSDHVLRRMRRRYTSGQYARLVERIRRRIPDCGIGADVIVGFPGEEEEHFEETHRFLADLPVSYLHVFTYSERPNTPAAGFGVTVPAPVRAERNAVLRALSIMKRQAFHEHVLGAEAVLLTESDVAGGMRYGFTENYVRLGIPADGTEENMLLRVRVRSAGQESCVGEIVERAGR